MSWRTTTFVVWGVLAVAVAALWLAAATRRARVARPGPLVLQTFAPVVRRAVLLLAWMWLGWHLFAR